jgi:hypothetical protein
MRASPALLGIILLALWLGAAILVAAVVAPAAFAVLPSRALAGALVGRVLPVIFWGGIIIGVAVFALARATSAGSLAMSGVAVLIAGCLIAQLVISPRIERIRDAVGGPIDALAVTDPRRIDFGRLHGLSVACMGVAGLGALLTLFVLMRTATSRNPS